MKKLNKKIKKGREEILSRKKGNYKNGYQFQIYRNRSK